MIIADMRLEDYALLLACAEKCREIGASGPRGALALCEETALEFERLAELVNPYKVPVLEG